MANSSDASAPNLIWDLVPLGDLLPDWQSHSESLHGSTTQRPAWVRLWQKHVNPDCFCIVARRDKELLLVLTLEVIRQGPLRIAIFPGGRHANENFPCISSELKAGSPDACLESVKAILRKKRPDVDAVYLQRQIQFLDGLTNPLLSVDKSTQTDIALSFTLNPDFQIVLDERDSSKKQKKIRKAGRRLEERGGWKFEVVPNKDDAQAALNRFFLLKAHRLAGKGIPNVFASHGVQDFFHALFARSIEEATGEFEMHILKVADNIMAVTGNSRLGSRLNVEFTAVDDSEPGVSHGEFLYFHMIGDACSRGIKTFSFGVGDEPFKRSWCNIETKQFNAALALTWKGTVAVLVEQTKTSAKRYVKANKRLYNFLKNSRKSAQSNSEL